MPRGSSRQFRTKYSGAANLLGIDGTANRLTDSGYVAEARGAFESQGFGVSGRNVSRIFQANADLAQAELGLSPFEAQTQSIAFDSGEGDEALFNSTEQVIGIANAWSSGTWYKPDGVTGTHVIWDLDQNAGDDSRLNILQSNANLAVTVRNTAGGNPVAGATWLNKLSAGVWTFIVVTWNGAASPKLRLYINGVDQGNPDSGDNDPSITMADDTRVVAVGNNSGPPGGSGALGRILYLALHRVELSQPAIETLFNLQNGGIGGAIDLNTNSGSYSSAGDLAHWWRCGNRASPNLGEDSAAAGFTPLIDIETNALNIDDADRVADVPS